MAVGRRGCGTRGCATTRAIDTTGGRMATAPRRVAARSALQTSLAATSRRPQDPGRDAPVTAPLPRTAGQRGLPTVHRRRSRMQCEFALEAPQADAALKILQRVSEAPCDRPQVRCRTIAIVPLRYFWSLRWCRVAAAARRLAPAPDPTMAGAD